MVQHALHVAHAHPGQRAVPGVQAGQAHHDAATALERQVAALQQGERRLFGVLVERCDGEPGRGGGFFAMTETVHDGDQDTVVDRPDEVEVPRFPLPLERQRRDTPMDERLRVAHAARHSTVSICAS
jgi:hypothetical protein